MSYLLDASVLVAALTNEVHTAAVQSWFAAHTTEELVASEWALTEFSAALSFKVRTGQMPLDEQLQSRAGLDRLMRDSLSRLPVRSRHFQTAANFAARIDSGLRSGDSLHLAIAHNTGTTMVTLDRGMHRGATFLRIPCRLLPSPA